MARRLVPGADDARDLVQETFLRAARFARSVPIGLANEEAWLVRVLINIRQDQWRKAAVRNNPAVRLHLDFSTQPSSPEAAAVAKKMVWQALDMLHPRRRAVVIMYELEGMSAAEIASLLGTSTVTVRWHLAKGRRDLTRVLKPHLGETR